MMPPSLLALSRWAHASWMLRNRSPRSERACADASAYLIGRYPQLLQLGTACAPWIAATLPRPAFARLLRVCAALACAHSLRLVVSAQARQRFLCGSGLSVLAAIQSHPRSDARDIALGAPLDCFDRRQLTAAGLAIALRTASGNAQRLWLELRLPQPVSDSARRFQSDRISPQTALELVGDAIALVREEQRPC